MPLDLLLAQRIPGGHHGRHRQRHMHPRRRTQGNLVGGPGQDMVIRLLIGHVIGIVISVRDGRTPGAQQDRDGEAGEED